MQHQAKSVRPFLGAKDFILSRDFYRDLGFNESVIDAGFSVFYGEGIAFYLQDCYVRDWIDNLQVFVEVDDVDAYYENLRALDLPSKYEGVRLSPVRNDYWGRECFLHDPSGILWHFGQFNA